MVEPVRLRLVDYRLDGVVPLVTADVIVHVSTEYQLVVQRHPAAVVNRQERRHAVSASTRSPPVADLTITITITTIAFQYAGKNERKIKAR